LGSGGTNEKSDLFGPQEKPFLAFMGLDHRSGHGRSIFRLPQVVDCRPYVIGSTPKSSFSNRVGIARQNDNIPTVFECARKDDQYPSMQEATIGLWDVIEVRTPARQTFLRFGAGSPKTRSKIFFCDNSGGTSAFT